MQIAPPRARVRPQEWARLIVMVGALGALTVLLAHLGRRPVGPPPRQAAPARTAPDTFQAKAHLPQSLAEAVDRVRDGGRFGQFTPAEWETARGLLLWLAGRPAGEIETDAVRDFAFKQFDDERFRKAVRGVPLHVTGILRDFRPIDLGGNPACLPRPLEPYLERRRQGFYAYLSWTEEGSDIPAGCTAYLAEGGPFRTGDRVSLDGVFLKLAYTFNALTEQKVPQPVLLGRRLSFLSGTSR